MAYKVKYGKAGLGIVIPSGTLILADDMSQADIKKALKYNKNLIKYFDTVEDEPKKPKAKKDDAPSDEAEA